MKGGTSPCPSATRGAPLAQGPREVDRPVRPICAPLLLPPLIGVGVFLDNLALTTTRETVLATDAEVAASRRPTVRSRPQSSWQPDTRASIRGPAEHVAENSRVRIGVWNLQGRWEERHLAHLDEMRCDIVLLTEVSERVEIPGMHLHPTTGLMAAKRRWAAVATRSSAIGLNDPHGATAMVEVDGLRVCSSILPWRSCGTRHPWVGSTTAAKTAAAVTSIETARPTVWGGDWNHAMAGREWSGSQGGRRSIRAAVDHLGLHVATSACPHQIDDLLSIDHIAIPETWRVLGVEHRPAFAAGSRLSDHDAYVVEVA